MSNKPLNEYKYKGLKIVDWGNEKFALEKSFKRKDSTEWERQKVTLFKSELEQLRKLIDQALGEDQETKNAIDEMQPQSSQPVPFSDDEIPW